MASSSSINTTNSATHTIPQTNPTTFNFTVPIKLDRQNYLMWKSQVLPSIRGNELEGFINSTKPCPNKFLVVVADDQTAETTVNPEYALWKKQDQLLLSWLLSSMNESVLSSVISCTTSYEVWNALERLFSSQSKARILQLRMQLQTQKKGSMTVSDFYSKMKNFADNLIASANPITEEDLVLYILAGLGSEYDPVVVNITARSDTLPLQEVYSLLLNHESRLDQLHTAANIASDGNISANYAQSTQN